MNAAPPVLSVRDLRVEFPTADGTVVAAAGVDFDVHEGECLGIVGESGSGKTVACQSLLGLIRPPGRVIAGSARFGGRNLLALPRAEIRAVRGAEIAMTFQDAQTALNPCLTVGEQIVEVVLAHGDRAAGRNAARARAIEMMELVGIPAAARRFDAFPHQFSGGMRQRIMIATALVCRPRLLIADEPTSALDVTVQAQVLELIMSMRRTLGMSVVLIAHDLGVVAEHCDRVSVMYAGQIVESGPTEEVIERPRHPYTRGLLASAPWLTGLDREIRPLAGFVPNLIDLPPHCHFAPRCPHRAEACLAPVPLIHGADGRALRCVRADALEAVA
jgi:oligopeptide/dipeptide ABC transporter ATP-binding protein